LADMIPGFRRVAVLGQGARSQILQVIEEASGRFYALKHVIRRSSADDRFIEQVETEYAVSCGIKHPHLRHSVNMHRNKKWLQTNSVMLVMEYVPGQTLEQHRPARLDHFLTIFRKVARGLSALHERGYVHADMKPNNIVLGAQGIVKIIDFGQSCPIGHRKVRIQGTPDYIAPEQVRRLTLDQRTDVFNLGATMYWALTSQTYPTDMPASADGSVAVVKADQLRSPKDINDKFPQALSQLVMDCCQSNPNERPQTMSEVESRLEMVQTLWRKKLDALKARRGQDAASSARRAVTDTQPSTDSQA